MQVYTPDINIKEYDSEMIKKFGKKLPNYNITILRDQNLHESDIVRITNTIGNVMNPRRFYMHPEYPGLFRVTNKRVEGEKIGIFADKELGWHSNGNGRKLIGDEACVALYCVKPGDDSITSFVDMRQAYDYLPTEVKYRLDNTVCNYQFKNNTFYNLDPDDKELVMFDTKKLYPEGVWKPLVHTHPYNGYRALFFSYHYIQGGLDKDTYNFLMEWCFQDRYVYHHEWEAGDFVFMDQWNSLHKRNEVKGDRLLYRICLDYNGSYGKKVRPLRNKNQNNS